jgi:hypothetical protein
MPQCTRLVHEPEEANRQTNTSIQNAVLAFSIF